MKSQPVQDAPYLTAADKARYSDLKVMQSNAGFYVGTTYDDKGVDMPGSRDSEYFRTSAVAEAHLTRLMRGEAFFCVNEAMA